METRRTEKGGFLVRENLGIGQDEVWTGLEWAGVPPNATDDQCLAVGGIRVTVRDSERIATQDAGQQITMVPNVEGN